MSWLRKVRVIQQMEAAECGLACLSMVLDYYGHSSTLAELRRRFGTSRDGITALKLLQQARRMGLVGGGVSAALGGLRSLKKPAILHWDFNHFVVLERSGSRSITIIDPATGRRSVSMAEASRRFSGVALELEPGKAFRKARRRSLGLARYKAALFAERRALAFVTLANVGQYVLAVALPAASQVLIDHVIIPRREQWLLPVVVVLLLITLVQIALHRLQGISQAILHSTLGLRLSREMGERLLYLPLPFLESRSHGDLIERVNMQRRLQTLLTQTVEAIFNFVFICLLSALMLAYDPLLGAISLGLTLARIPIMRWAQRPMAQRMAGELAAQGREFSALAEATTAMELTKGLGIETQLRGRYARRVQERAGWSIASARIEVGLGRTMSALDAIMLAIVLWVGGGLVIAGEMTIGVFSGFLAIRAMLGAPLASLITLAENWMRVRGILERCDDILGVEPLERVTPAGLPLTSGRLELRGVGFRYSTQSPWLFRNVNLSIEPGQYVVVIGPSGQGKSTLGKLACGLLEPTEGCVLLDGRDVRTYDQEELAARFGVVLQEPLILEGSVHEALTVRDPAASPERALLAAKLACFDEVVQRMPNGYASRLDALGGNLSGGERQRLAIAQALLNNPRFLLLDEGTCSLDAALEQRVLDNLRHCGSTVVSIAHREAVIDRADRLLIVLEGQVVETAAAFGRQPAGFTRVASNPPEAACHRP